MKTNVHIRIIVSRGIKSTPYQDPDFTISPPTIVMIPEYKIPDEKIIATELSQISDFTSLGNGKFLVHKLKGNSESSSSTGLHHATGNCSFSRFGAGSPSKTQEHF